MDQMEIHTIIGDIDTICPVSEIKNYLRIDNTDDDTLLEDIRQYASDCAENYAGVDFIAKRRKLFLSSLPYDGVVILPFANENVGTLDMTINSVKDMDNNTISDYEFLGTRKSQIKFNDPNLTDIIIDYQTTGAVTQQFKMILFKMIANLYDFRSDFIAGKAVNILPGNTMQLLDKYKTPFI